MKFWSIIDNVDSAKIEIVSSMCGIHLDKQPSDPSAKPSETRQPRLELSDSISLNDTQASLIYLTSFSGNLYPEDSQVLIDSWLEVTQTQFKPALTAWVSPYLGRAEFNAAVNTASSKDCKALIKDLDLSLKKSKFLCGDSISLADISLASELFTAFKLVIDENTRKGFKSVVEWMNRVAEVAEFKAVWGDLILCTKAAELPGAVKEESKEKVAEKKPVVKTKNAKKEDVKIDKEAMEKKQKERAEKKERDAKAKLEAEMKKKEEEAKGNEGEVPKN